MQGPAPTPAPIAAIDLGSNSFHLVVGREVGGWISIVDRMRDPVRLAAGLSEDDVLAEERVQAMLASLRRFRERLAGVPAHRIRAIGTNTFRKARGPADLLERAQVALGCPIEILSGAEEARLIYKGVSRELPPSEESRLVVDIGGGSTECVLGEGTRPLYTDSMHMGCVSYSHQYFPGGEITRDAFRAAETAAKMELETIVERFRAHGWSACFGSSGTIIAAGLAVDGGGEEPARLDRAAVKRLRKALVSAGHVDRVDFPGVQPDRSTVLPGGVAILKACFDMLGIETMQPTKAALREGLLYDLLGRFGEEDLRERTIAAMAQRYHVDPEQAGRVERTAMVCFDKVATAWDLDREARLFLRWAARVHEVGLAIAYTQYHHHGAYIVENTNMPGFSRQEQERLASLVVAHRRKLRREYFAEQPASWRKRLRRLALLLRLSVRLNRARPHNALPAFDLQPDGDVLHVTFPPGWLVAHPLTRADLEDERKVLASGGMGLEIG